MGVTKKTRKFAQVSDSLCIGEIPAQTSLQVKRIIGQRDARLKKNQDKAVIESKRKSKDEIVREMSASSYSLQSYLSNASQTSSFLVSFLPIQHRYVSSFCTSPPGIGVSRAKHMCLVLLDSNQTEMLTPNVYAALVPPYSVCDLIFHRILNYVSSFNFLL